ncbi:cation:proton antiporter [Mycolicibacterium sp. P1-5]|uniref:cation:proton antiporter n=1 Tax=Mycolicibacterium sp. P1-5 TaxID=2024617 RepID=UPI0011EC274C|nr:cation:proton antiporter [Mycolicibacterium sp. P1-5]KAA0106173.1 cation:proton antiporter [Mycolicibacterium sp. P1-5]
MAGPLLASVPRLRIPVVIGELAVGLLIGRTGFGLVDADDKTFTLLADIGFALVMFVVGTHVPIRDVTLRASVPKAALRAVLVGVVATAIAVGLATVFHTGHVAVYAVLMASSSAALALPVIQALGIDGPSVKGVTAQIAIADATSIVLLPLVIDPHRALTAAVGAVLIALCACLLFIGLWVSDRRGWRKRLHHFSQANNFALELRISLIVLFTLATLALTMHVSIMLAGFALGVAVKAAGEPRRLARQLFGITEGLFGPLFFVWLGASLQVRELGDHPGYIGLGIGLGVGAVLAHCVGLLTGQPLALAALAAAQLGVPVAAATLGTQTHLLTPGEPSALMLGALLTIGVTSIAGVAAASRHRAQTA